MHHVKNSEGCKWDEKKELQSKENTGRRESNLSSDLKNNTKSVCLGQRSAVGALSCSPVSINR